ncbi:MAG: hypothetical protein ACE5IT_07430 [bacterium]
MTDSTIRFCADAKEIIDRTKNARWSGSRAKDYVIVVKLHDRNKVTIVADG